MPAKKMRVELFDTEGNRYTIAFEGHITREKAIRILDIVELLGGMPGDEMSSEGGRAISDNEFSKFAKVRLVVQKSFPLVWFSSRDVQSAYEQELKEPIKLSTVSTYLARLVKKTLLIRAGNSNRLKYRVTPSMSPILIKQRIK